MRARDTEGVEYEDGVARWMNNRKNSHWAIEASEATSDAKDLGWESW